MIALLYIPVLLILAAWNAALIRKGKRIYHALNGLLHAAVAIAVWLLSHWTDGLAILPLTKLVFDTALNAMRGLPLDYTSPEVKQYTGLRMAWDRGKVMDFIEWRLFHNALVAKILYAGATAALIIA
jgi:hypothetical protein